MIYVCFHYDELVFATTERATVSKLLADQPDWKDVWIAVFDSSGLKQDQFRSEDWVE